MQPPPQAVVLSQAGLEFIQNPQRTDAGHLTSDFMKSVTKIYLRINHYRLLSYDDLWGWFEPLFYDFFNDKDLATQAAWPGHNRLYRQRWRNNAIQKMNQDSADPQAIPDIQYFTRNPVPARVDNFGFTVLPNRVAAINDDTQAYVVIGEAQPDNPPAPPPPPQFPPGLVSEGETVNRRSNRPEGWLYVLTHPNFLGWVKIGRTRNLGRRLSSYNTGTPNAEYNYLIQHHYPDGAQPYPHATPVEQAIHTALRPIQNVGDTSEWYQMTVEAAIQTINEHVEVFNNGQD
jgi:hypothetical protein